MDDWDIEWARNMIVNGGRFGPKRVCEAVYKHNVAVFADWARGGDGGIDLGDRKALLDGTRVYAQAFSVADAPKVEGEMKTGAINADCIDVAEELVHAGYKPAILNLASRWHACGGYHDGTSAQEESIMLDKICTIYRLALKNGHDSIVLGAFGCGVFHLRPDLVAAMFARVLEENEFKGKFRALPFAILEGRGTARKSVEEQGKFAAFYQQFGRWV